MDNYSSNGSTGSEDIFGFIPPNLMYNDYNPKNRRTSLEEQARHEYEIDHMDTLHITDMSPITKFY